MTSHRDVTGRGYGICGELLRTSPQLPQPRRRRLDEIKNTVIQTSGARGTRLGKLYLLDTGLLMGGTHVVPLWLVYSWLQRPFEDPARHELEKSRHELLSESAVLGGAAGFRALKYVIRRGKCPDEIIAVTAPL